MLKRKSWRIQKENTPNGVFFCICRPGLGVSPVRQVTTRCCSRTKFLSFFCNAFPRVKNVKNGQRARSAYAGRLSSSLRVFHKKTVQSPSAGGGKVHSVPRFSRGVIFSVRSGLCGAAGECRSICEPHMRT
ncbi:hypothetical protein D3C84_184650 [compost metagenome]